MNYTDRVKKLEKGIDDVYANLHLIPHLQNSQKHKLSKLHEELTFHLERERGGQLPFPKGKGLPLRQ